MTKSFVYTVLTVLVFVVLHYGVASLSTVLLCAAFLWVLSLAIELGYKYQRMKEDLRNTPHARLEALHKK